MDSRSDLSRALAYLTKAEIESALDKGTFVSAQKRSRQKMEEAIDGLSVEQRSTLERAGAAKKRKIETTEGEIYGLANSASPTQDFFFFETVSETCRQERLSKFIDATGTHATSTAVCAVCAGRFFIRELREVPVDDLREKKKLSPSKPHPAHVLTEGMLLHRTESSIHTDEHGTSLANVCVSCTSDLRNKKTPPLSLANGMWIGDVPLELKVLTLPERLLVARFFPAAYIVKLYPKKRARVRGRQVVSTVACGVTFPPIVLIRTPSRK